MEWISIDKNELGSPLYITPVYSDYFRRSFIDYHSGIPEIDDTLSEKKKKFSDMRAELSILIYNDILMFIFMRRKKGLFQASLNREMVLKINAIHGQKLPIRKDPKIYNNKVLIFISMFLGLFGAITAITTEIATDLILKLRKDKLVLGSVFEIILNSKKNNEYEKVTICCTNKNREIIENILNKIVKSPQ